MAIIGGERDLIVKEQAEEEARIRNAKLEELKRMVTFVCLSLMFGDEITCQNAKRYV